jgi:hypothetical protein
MFLAENFVDHFSVTDANGTVKGIKDFGVGCIPQQMKHGS